MKKLTECGLAVQEGREAILYIPGEEDNYVPHKRGCITYNKEWEGFYIGGEPIEDGDLVRIVPTRGNTEGTLFKVTLD